MERDFIHYSKVKEDLKQVIGDEETFANQPELREVLQRLVLTLIQENILESTSLEGVTRMQQLSPNGMGGSVWGGEVYGKSGIERAIAMRTFIAYAHNDPGQEANCFHNQWHQQDYNNHWTHVGSC